MDLRQAIQRIAFEKEDAEPENVREFGYVPGIIRMRAIVSAQEPTLNPELLINALRQTEPTLCPDFARFLRCETYDAEGNVFR